ncbi:Hok/Gef family protein [Serratia entomophila]
MMPDKRSVLKLIVICATVISLAWITHSQLCELRIRPLIVGALIHEHPPNKNGEPKARRFHVDAQAYFRPAASRSSAALSVASQGKCSRPKWP